MVLDKWFSSGPRRSSTGANEPSRSSLFAHIFNTLLGRGSVDEDDATYKDNTSQHSASEKERIVRANDREFNVQFNYADNYIKTSKYDIITFVPMNLWEQFQRLANFYFLVLMCLQFIPFISSVAWYSTALPLSFVLVFSAIKDGYDDVQRHRSDNQVNNRVSYIVSNGRLEDEQWMNVKVGDIVRMENEHFIAADLLLLSSSEPFGLCYIETAELDGETNLKSRCALLETAKMGDIVSEIAVFDGEVRCEPPNNRLDHFEGCLYYKSKQYPLDNSRMLLRGCRLRNTRWCYGLVVFAGRDTKLMMNSGRSKLKRTTLDRFLNVLILGIVLFLAAMCAICMVLSFVWETVTGKHFVAYLPWEHQLLGLNLSEGDQSLCKIFLVAFLQFFSYVILLNTVVPISLYISVEVLRFGHSLFINNDRKMYDEKTETPARARTTTLNEELGQVQYIFSDKTGTLTQNIMVFKKCSIHGRSYGDLLNDRSEIIEIDELTPSIDFSWNRWREPAFKFYDKTLLVDTQNGVSEVQKFWRLLAICHTVMPERKHGNQLEYQAQSPDEAALTSAARNFGFVFKSRTPQSITLEVNGKEESYEVLHILDFDNVRKRMSVIVRFRNDEPPKITLYCKGADTVIFERLSATDTSELMKSATLQHLDKFANDGLRTLCLAYKHIDPDYCEKWMVRQREAALDVKNKNQRLDELYEEIEKDMVLLGATAIEDKLQDGVPRTISTLAAANIRIWVLTGDKTETAINIGYSCRLLTEDMREVFVIDGADEHEVEVQLKDIKRRIDRVAANNSGGCDNGSVAVVSQNFMSASNLNDSTLLTTCLADLRHCTVANTRLPTVSSFVRTFFGCFKRDACEREESLLATNRCTFGVFNIFRQFCGVLLRRIFSTKRRRAKALAGRRHFSSGDIPVTVADYIQRQIEILENAEEASKRKALLDNESVEDLLVDERRFSLHEGSETSFKEYRQKSAQTAPQLYDKSQSVQPTGFAATSMRRFSAGGPAGLQLRSKLRRKSVFDEEIRNPRLSMEKNDSATTGQQVDRALVMTNGTDVFYQKSPKYLSASNGRASNVTSLSQTVTLENGFAKKAEEVGESVAAQLDGFALVINGSSLTHALKPKYEKLFLDIGCLCISVICCRVTPLQKAQVVELMKRHVKAVTLAIGDGANDVSMIKAAHIGVGISGQEGMQAVLASDFSIAQFRYLERLLLVHGRWSYLRMSKFLRYFFYKNFSYTLTHFWYSFFCGYSAQTIYDPMLIACYNMFFTSLPILAMGLFDQDVNDEYSLRYPILYVSGQYNLFFNMRIFVYSIIHGGVSSLVLFFIPYGVIFHSADPEGRDRNDFITLSFLIFTSLVIVVTGQIMFDTSYWTVFNHICILGSLLIYFAMVIFIYEILPGFLQISSILQPYGVAFQSFRLPQFWLCILLICTVLLVPVMANRFFWFDTRPSFADRLRVYYRLNADKRGGALPPSHADAPQRLSGGSAISKCGGGGGRTAPSRRSGRCGSLRSGYAFSHTQGFGELIAKGTLFRNLEGLRMPSLKHSDSPKTGSTCSKSKRDNKTMSSKATATSSPLSKASSKVHPITEERQSVSVVASPPLPPSGKQRTSDASTSINTTFTSDPPSASKSERRQAAKQPQQTSKHSGTRSPHALVLPMRSAIVSDDRQENSSNVPHRLLIKTDSAPMPNEWDADFLLYPLERPPAPGHHTVKPSVSTIVKTDAGAVSQSAPPTRSADTRQWSRRDDDIMQIAQLHNQPQPPSYHKIIASESPLINEERTPARAVGGVHQHKAPDRRRPPPSHVTYDNQRRIWSASPDYHRGQVKAKRQQGRRTATAVGNPSRSNNSSSLAGGAEGKAVPPSLRLRAGIPLPPTAHAAATAPQSREFSDTTQFGTVWPHQHPRLSSRADLSVASGRSQSHGRERIIPIRLVTGNDEQSVTHFGVFADSRSPRFDERPAVFQSSTTRSRWTSRPNSAPHY